jgi:hypothetical protein
MTGVTGVTGIAGAAARDTTITRDAVCDIDGTVTDMVAVPTARAVTITVAALVVGPGIVRPIVLRAETLRIDGLDDCHIRAVTSLAELVELAGLAAVRFTDVPTTRPTMGSMMARPVPALLISLVSTAPFILPMPVHRS